MGSSVINQKVKLREFDFEGEKWLAAINYPKVGFSNGRITVTGELSTESPKIGHLQASLDAALPTNARERLMKKVDGKGSG